MAGLGDHGTVPRRRWFVLSAALLVTAVGLYLLGTGLYRRGLDRADQLASVGSFFVALLGLLVPVLARLLGWADRPRAVPDVDLDRVLDQLAADLDARWAEEERIRRVHDPAPLTVRWRTDGVESGADSLLDEYLRSEPPRLVVLGEPGAGKSVLVIRLLRDLLARRPGGAVPVIVPATAWDTGRELHEWLAAELCRGHPGLAQPVRTATGTETTVAATLVAGGHVVPIVDGLDEVPVTRHPALIARLNAAGTDTPLVVTCRTEQYRSAVVRGGRPIGRAVELELTPIGPDDVRGYLAEATAVVPPDRWSAVFDRLRAEPDGPLAQALGTPLMLWLARTAYESPASSPSVLADRDALPDREAIESHLLDTFVAAAYRSGAPRGWSVRQVTRWLGFLADQLEWDRTGGLAWWRLRSGMPGGRLLWRVARAALATGLAWWCARRLADDTAGTRPGSALDALLGGPLGRPLRRVLDELTVGAADRYADVGWRWLGRQLDAIPVSAVVAMAVVLVAVVEVSEFVPDFPPRRLRLRPRSLPSELLSRLTGGIGWAALPLVWFVLVEPASAAAVIRDALDRLDARHVLLLVALLAPLALRRAGQLVTGAADTRALDPLSVARSDRRADLVDSVLAAAVLVGLTALYAAPTVVLGVLAYTAVMLPVRLLLGGSFTSASQAYLSARLWLALRGRLPWRTLDFLADAHRRGVLRQVGAEYQFRHERLRVRLRDDYRRSRPYERIVPRLLAVAARHSTWAAVAARRWDAAPAAERDAYRRFLAALSTRPVLAVDEDSDENHWGALEIDPAVLSRAGIAAAIHRARSRSLPADRREHRR